MFSCFMEYYRQPMKLACCVWDWLLDLWLVVKHCRFSVISLIIGFVFFGIAPQGIDILRAMTETGQGRLWSFVVFYACIWVWALSIWYWARHLLRFEHIYISATATGNRSRAERLVEEAPRVLGGLAFWSLWVALLESGRIYPESMETGLAIAPELFAYIYFFSGVLFYLFAKYRRWLLGRLLHLPRVEQLHKGFITDFSQMPVSARFFAIALLIMSLVALVWTSIEPVSAGAMGTQNLLLIAAANWVFIGSVLVFYSEKFHVPVVLVMLLLALLFSNWNDNHVMRTSGELVQDDRSTIDEHFAAWLKPRLQKWQQDPATADKSYPVFFVAAEGGGIRAAYWTANVLGALQDANEQFAGHVYAMSGVSGGSLGIATFAAMLKAKQQNAAFDNRCLGEAGRFSYQVCAHAFLQNDFLAPAAGRMLYGDLIQRFLPFSIATFDRAAAIEKAWEAAWKKLTATDYFNEPFLQLYEGTENLPVLFLNTTWVEKGFRSITTNVLQDEHFLNLKDLHEVTQHDLRLSTAVHNSARFTYVSPAGTVKKASGETWGHLVDGGYFENSGATTLAEAYQSVRETAANDWSAIIPVVLMITNEPTQDDEAHVDASPVANEILSPVKAMLNTRGGRGSLARANMKKLVSQDGIFKEFGLQNVDGPVPLGWMLSQAAMRTMDQRLDCYVDELREDDPLNISAGQLCNSKK